jgi:hypothetical protein
MLDPQKTQTARSGDEEGVSLGIAGPLARRTASRSELAAGHSGLAEVPYRCATAPDFHRTFPIPRPTTIVGTASDMPGNLEERGMTGKLGKYSRSSHFLGD